MFESLSQDNGTVTQTAEEFFDNNPDALEVLPCPLFVRVIEMTKYGYKLHTDLFTCYSSHKFRKIAGAVKQFIEKVNSTPSYKNKRPTSCPAPMVLVKGLNDKGYVDFEFGQTTATEYASIMMKTGNVGEGNDGWTFFGVETFDEKGNCLDPVLPHIPDSPLLQYVVDSFVSNLDIPVAEIDPTPRTRRGKGQG